jgi:hypothetical protein
MSFTMTVTGSLLRLAGGLLEDVSAVVFSVCLAGVFMVGKANQTVIGSWTAALLLHATCGSGIALPLTGGAAGESGNRLL